MKRDLDIIISKKIRLHNGVIKTFYTCNNCGKEYTTKRGGKEGKKFCCRKCAFDWMGRNKKPVPFIDREKKCIMCGIMFVAKNMNEVYCSQKCKRNMQKIKYDYPKCKKEKEERRNRPLIEKRCLYCNKIFKTNMNINRRKYCSKKCLAGEERKRRNALKRGANKVESVSYDTVYQRDKGICYLCGGLCSYEYNNKDVYSGTLDHVIPMYFGGDHTYNNIRLAHLTCNAKKSNKILIRQGDI